MRHTGGGAAARSHTIRTRRWGVTLAVTLVAGLVVLPATSADADHEPFPITQGIYRIPYLDGTNVTVVNAHHDHNDAYDMTAGAGAEIVAAASGWIRGIVDHNGESPNPGDGLDASEPPQPQDDALEHSCLNNPQENTVTGSCSDYNNYVWIEHPNGEYTKYSHFGTGTVSLPQPAGYGWQEGDWVDAGDVLGLESDIGAAQGAGGNPFPHLHHEAAAPNDPSDDLEWTTKGGFITNGTRLVPLVCDIPDNLYEKGEDYTAAPCEHDPPTADAGGPYATTEGTPIILDATGSADPDGAPLTYQWEPAAFLDDPSSATPTFLAGDDAIVAVELRVYDQVEALVDSDTTTVAVGNVAPSVAIDPAQVTAIDEDGTVTVVAEFTDPGFGDTHTATIDWGVPAGHAGVEVVPPAIQILDPGDPGPIVGRVTGTYRYGDDDDGAGFPITVAVTDDDGSQGTDAFALTVHNVDPAAAIDPAGTVLLDGVPTVVTEIGAEVPFASHTLDPGSDDLTLAWDWDDGTTDSRLSRVNPPADDPLPSPTVQSRSEPDEVTHTFTDACLYEVTFAATDDDGGHAADTLAVVVAGLADQARSAGYWRAEYRGVKHADLSPATLQCYLDIVNHVSGVFSEHRALVSFDDAVAILWTPGSADADDLFDVQLLAAWLNLANGAYALDEPVDTDGDAVADSVFLDVLEDAEALRVDPNRTREEVLAVKDVLEGLNT